MLRITSKYWQKKFYWMYPNVLWGHISHLVLPWRLFWRASLFKSVNIWDDEKICRDVSEFIVYLRFPRQYANLSWSSNVNLSLLHVIYQIWRRTLLNTSMANNWSAWWMYICDMEHYTRKEKTQEIQRNLYLLQSRCSRLIWLVWDGRCYRAFFFYNII